MSDALRPCPFCGDEAICIGARVFHDIKCPGCGTLSGTKEYKAEAIAAWNRRTPEPMTSVIHWVRYDSTPETLPENLAGNRYQRVLLVREKYVVLAAFTRLRSHAEIPGIWNITDNGWKGERVPNAKIGDVWAYLPNLPEATA